MAIHPMSPMDAAWYHMDGSANLAMVTGVVLTKEPLEFESVRAVYKARMAMFDRFSQRVVESGLPVQTPHWEDMPHFDIDQHLHHIALPAPHDHAALRALIADIASSPLDHEQPLWQVHVVDDVAGGSALVMRYHHCIADGTAMMTVMRQLFDAAPGTPRRRDAPAQAGPSGRGKGGDVALVPGFDAIARAARGAVAAARATIDVMAHPKQAIDAAALVLGGSGMLLAELLKPADPQSPFKGDFGMRKHVAWSDPVAIGDVKAIGALYGATVNDVLVAGMTGALRAYLKLRGFDVKRTTVRAMVPVDLRPAERVGQLGNEFGLVLLELAVQSARAAQRLAITKARMDALKRSPEPVAVGMLFRLLGRGPKAIEDMANDMFGSKASIVMTNVAGPRETLYLAGVPVDRIMFWNPHPGRQLGMGISIMSYRGMASLAVTADARLVPDPQTITELFNRQFSTMLRAVEADASGVRAKAPAASRTRAHATGAGRPAGRSGGAGRPAHKKA
jgi:diacylglycerol O-acyltransferase / wax synthase